MSLRVAILGCGPSGMFAAHAAVRSGHQVDVFSKYRTEMKSHMNGAQYLHLPIPGLSRNPFRIRYEIDGEIEVYKTKVYGEMEDVVVSPETLVGEHDAWDIREAYDAAWDLYGDNVIIWSAESGRVPSRADGYDLVISTIPAVTICESPSHKFPYAAIWSTDYVRAKGAFVYEDGAAVDNLVVCSGLEEDWWYRASRIQGHENTEYPFDKKPKLMTDSEGRTVVWEVMKPISTDCDCHPEIVRIGRYGRWTKGVLSHSAYYETRDAIERIESALSR